MSISCNTHDPHSSFGGFNIQSVNFDKLSSEKVKNNLKTETRAVIKIGDVS
jgi:hypothetical protein